MRMLLYGGGPVRIVLRIVVIAVSSMEKQLGCCWIFMAEIACGSVGITEHQPQAAGTEGEHVLLCVGSEWHPDAGPSTPYHVIANAHRTPPVRLSASFVRAPSHLHHVL